MRKRRMYLAMMALALLLTGLAGCSALESGYTLKMDYTRENFERFAKGLEKSAAIKSVYVEDFSYDDYDGSGSGHLWITSQNREYGLLFSFYQAEGRCNLGIYTGSFNTINPISVIEQVERMLTGESVYAEKTHDSLDQHYMLGDYDVQSCGFGKNDLTWYRISIHI